MNDFELTIPDLYKLNLQKKEKAAVQEGGGLIAD